MSRSRLTWLLVLALCSGALVSNAGCRDPGPRTKDVDSSANGRFFKSVDDVKKNRNERKLAIFAKDNKEDPVWTIDEVLYYQKCVISDDGENVAVLWRPWHEGDSHRGGTIVALSFWNRERGQVKTYRLEQLCDDFSQVGKQEWFGKPWPVQPWFVSASAKDGKTLQLRTIDNFEYEFSLATGDILSKEQVLSTGEKILLGGAITIGFIVLGILIMVGIAVYSLRLLRQKKKD
jgi:hypothetical protein